MHIQRVALEERLILLAQQNLWKSVHYIMTYPEGRARGVYKVKRVDTLGTMNALSRFYGKQVLIFLV